MIGYLKGEVAGIYEDSIVLEVNGIGYNIFMPQSSIDKIVGLGESIKVYTYLSVREDAMLLYGFLSKDDLDFYKMLITVNGIGPKAAMTMLSYFSVRDIKYAIISADSKTISKCPGIGPKSAQRIIIDLKDKISTYDLIDETFNDINGTNDDSYDSEAASEAKEALMALGYSAAQSLKAVDSACKDGNTDVEAILKAALRVINN